MATKTSPSRRPSSRPSGRSSSKGRKVQKGRSAPKKRATKKAASRKRAHTTARTPTREVLSPHARDAAGIGLVVLALLAVLAVWMEAAGPVGRGLSILLHGTFGVAAVVFPLIGVFWGWVLLKNRAAEDRMRMFIGFFVLMLGSLGLLSLLLGNPSPFSGMTATPKTVGLAEAAGVIGAIAAYPLSRVVSVVGVGDRVRGARQPRRADLHGDAVLGRARVTAPRRQGRVRPGARIGRPTRGAGARTRRGCISRQAEEGPVAPGRRGPRGPRPGRAIAGGRRAPRVGGDRRPGAEAGARSRRAREAQTVPQVPDGDDLVGSLPAPAARSVADGTLVLGRRDARDRDDVRAWTHPAHLRRRCQGRRRSSRPDGDDVRGRGRQRHQGQQGAEPVQRHRLRPRHARRADPGADPRSVGDRHRGPEPAS